MLRLLVTVVSIFSGIHCKKNVLFIFGDDAGFQMGAYNNTACKTPNFDKLAARSVIFQHGFTSVSSCSPSRSVLLTGLPVHQNGMYGLAQNQNHFASFDAVMSLPVILGKSGIRTGIIGKKHVTPASVYQFEYAQTEENNDLNQVGRNITYMLNYVREFLNNEDPRPFYLYLAFHDPHRCGNIAQYGQFCERFGNGQPGMGRIPDWTPVYYNPSDVEVPYYLPDTPTTRKDLANMYTTYSRMDQGIGLFLTELEKTGHMEDTLVIYSSDNGIPFPGAKTNLYEPGMGEPMLISDPTQKQNWGKRTQNLASLMDMVPTILDWFNVAYPKYKIFKGQVKLTGQSLLPVTADVNAPGYQWVFSSHNFHEVTMNYPMRVIRDVRYRLIHNLNNKAPFPMAADIYQSPTFLDILNKTMANQTTHWFKSLHQYYYRDEWELYDLDQDPHELNNIVNQPSRQDILKDLRQKLVKWQQDTEDTWVCFPEGVLENAQCDPLDN